MQDLLLNKCLCTLLCTNEGAAGRFVAFLVCLCLEICLVDGPPRERIFSKVQREPWRAC